MCAVSFVVNISLTRSEELLQKPVPSGAETQRSQSHPELHRPINLQTLLFQMVPIFTFAVSLCVSQFVPNLFASVSVPVSKF